MKASTTSADGDASRAQLPSPGDLLAFAQMVAQAFQALTSGYVVFAADLDGDALCAEYLAAFPEGSDPLFRKRTDHDCHCCKQFIRHAGGVVSIASDGRVHTVWDRAAEEAPGPYRVVAARMRDIVRAAGVRDLYRVSEKVGSFGAARTRCMDKE